MSALLSIATLLAGLLGSSTPGAIADAGASAPRHHELHACVDAPVELAVDLVDPVETDPEVAQPVDEPTRLFGGGAILAEADAHDSDASGFRRQRPARGPPAA